MSFFVALAALANAAQGCVLVADVDVCERSHVERQLNQFDPAGAQRIGAPSAIAVLPSGRALLVYSSADALTPDSNVGAEIRGLRLTQAGEPELLCGPRLEHVYVESDSARIRRAATATAAFDRPARGLVAYIDSGPKSLDARLHGVFTIDDGCPEATLFPISDEETGTVWTHSEVTVASSQFVAVWTELDFSGVFLEARPRARVFEHVLPDSPPSFVPTTLDSAGRSVTLDTPERTVQAVAATNVGDRTFAVAFLSAQSGRLRVYVAVYDAALRTVTPPTMLDQRDGADDITQLSVSVAARDGDILVAFTTPERDGGSSVHAAMLTRGGTVVPVDLGTTVSAANYVAAVALDDGFLVAWAGFGAAGEDDADGSGIRASVIGPSGRPRFANPACGADSFQLNAGRAGDQYRPSLGRFGDGFIAAWVDAGGNGSDSDEGLRGTVLRGYELFPREAP